MTSVVHKFSYGRSKYSQLLTKSLITVDRKRYQTIEIAGKLNFARFYRGCLIWLNTDFRIKGRIQREFENRVLRLSGQTGNEMTDVWRQLFNEDFLHFFARKTRLHNRGWGRHAAGMGTIIQAHNLFYERLEGKRQLRRPGRKCEGNI